MIEHRVRVSGQRLDQFLRDQMPQYSRSFLQKLTVRVNDAPAKPSYRVRMGDRVTVEIPAPVAAAAAPEEIPLDVLFEDDDLLVINKPAGMVVHPAAGNQTGTLVNALLHHCRGQLAGIGGVERPGIVHRLDKGTSGCLVVAKTDAAHQSLAAQFKGRAVTKIYRAVCWGTFDRRSGRVEATIGRSPYHRQKMAAGAPRGRPALTEYRVLQQFDGGALGAPATSARPCGSAARQEAFALVELTLHTGRTHQIRVHMAHIGHPVAGDTVYGKRKTHLERLWLHAYKLGFNHPRTGERLEFTAPLPAEMEQLCPT